MDCQRTMAGAGRPLADIETFLSLQALEVDCWYVVDHHRGAGADPFYVDDSVFTIGDETMRGKEEVAASIAGVRDGANGPPGIAFRTRGLRGRTAAPPRSNA